MTNKSVKGYVLLPWVFATTVGAVIGATVCFNLIDIVAPSETLTARVFVTSTILGSALGIAQWLVIRRWLRANLWVLNSILSWSIGGTVCFLPVLNTVADFLVRINLLPSISFFISSIAVGSVQGTSIGLFQWFALRSQVPRASSWIWINTIAYAVSTAVISLGRFLGIGIDWAGSNLYEVVLITYVALFGVVSGSITGRRLEQLLRQIRSNRGD